MFLSSKIRELYKSRPSLYRIVCSILNKCFHLIYLGIIAIILALIALVYSFTIKIDSSLYTYFLFGMLALVLLFILINVVFINSIKIKGLYIEEEKYEKLMEMVKTLNKEFKGIKIHDVVIIDTCIIDIITQYKHGLWGRKNTSLVIGLPILLGFSEKEVELAIVNAICKNSKRHKLLERNVRKTYLKLENLFSNDRNLINTNKIFNILVKPILRRFHKFYKDSVYILIMNNSIESDKFFMEKYTDKELFNLILKKYTHRYLVETVFIKKINKKIEEKEEIPKDFFKSMNEYLNENVSGRDITDALKILRNTDRNILSFIGTPLHRIENTRFGIEDFQYEFGDNSARLFGKNFDKVINKFDLLWYKLQSKEWENNAKLSLKEKDRYDKLCRDFAMYNLLEKDFKVYISLREKFSGSNTAIIEGKKLCITYPYNAEIKYLVGNLLLKGNNEQGVSYIENAIKLNPFVSIEGYKDIIDYYIRKDSYDVAARYKKEYALLMTKVKEGLKERNKPKLSRKNYLKLDLEKESLMEIRNVFQSKSYVKKAYISKLKVKKFKDISHYIIWIDYKLGFFTMEETLINKNKEITKDIGLSNITVVHLNGDKFYVKIPLKNIKKYKIFSRRRNFH